MGLNRTSQLRLPITIAAAGLPNLASPAGEAKSYAGFLYLPNSSAHAAAPIGAALACPELAGSPSQVLWNHRLLLRLAGVDQGHGREHRGFSPPGPELSPRPPACRCGKCSVRPVRARPDPGVGWAPGRAAKLATGGYAGGRPLFGWGAEGKELVLDQRKQEIIGLARQFNGAGLSSRQIADPV
jgi:hypothetical protein